MIFERGIIHGYDSTNHLAAVQLFGSMSRIIVDVPVAHHIGEELLTDGAACVVGFVADGSQGVILATFDGAPGGWVTSGMIKDAEIATADVGAGEITPAKLSFSPPTFEFGYSDSSSSQTVVNSWQQYQSVQVTVTPTGGQYFNVLVVQNVDMENTGWTAWNIACTRVYRDTTGKGQTSRVRFNANNERCTIMAHYADRINNARTYKLYVYKAINRNTIVANNGSISVIWSADTV